MGPFSESCLWEVDFYKKTSQNQVVMRGFWSTEGRDRTGTSVTSSVFETDASTDSATSAWFGLLAYTANCGCKNTEFFFHRKHESKKN